MNSNVLLICGAAVSAVAAFAVYRWQQRSRVRGVKTWINAFLAARYGSLPGDVHINCSDDRFWPVLVDFALPGSKNRHRMQFACPGPQSTYTLISEMEEQR